MKKDKEQLEIIQMFYFDSITDSYDKGDNSKLIEFLDKSNKKTVIKFLLYCADCHSNYEFNIHNKIMHMFGYIKHGYLKDNKKGD